MTLARTSYAKLVLVCLFALVMCALFAPSAALAFVDPNEPDDTLLEAKNVAVDGTPLELWYEGSSVSYKGIDWLRFEGRAGMSYRVRITRGTVWSLPEPTFHGIGGNEIQHESGYAPTEWIYYAAEDAPVFVKLPLTSWMETGSYFVSVEEGTGESLGLADQYEPDNTVRSAKAIPTDGTTQYRVNDITDLARFTVRKGWVYRIDTGYTDGSGYAIASVVNTAGVEVVGRELISQWSPSRYFTASEDAVYYLKVDDGHTYNRNSYRVAITEMQSSVLTGAVTRAVDGVPVAGARVLVFWSDVTGWHPSHLPPIAVTETAGDGSWSVPVQPGTYVVRFEDPAGILLPEYWGGAIPPTQDASPIHVGERALLIRNGQLWSRSAVDGVVATKAGAPVAGSSVTLDYHTTVTSDAEGKFTFAGLEPRVQHRLTATPVGEYIPVGPVKFTVATGATASVTVPMSLPGKISGTVTDGSRGVPATGIVVNVWSMGTEGMLPQSAVVDEFGNYTITGLQGAGYRVSFTDPAGKSGPYGRRWWGTSEYGWDDPVPVVIGEETTDIDATLFDKEPPQTTTTVTSGWRSGPVEISFDATDQGWMGTTTWFTRPGSSAPETYTGPFDYNNEGTGTFTYWSADDVAADGSRNVEGKQSVTVRIDNTAPKTTATGVKNGDTLMAPATIELDARDVHSGLKFTRWKVGDREGSGPLVGLSNPGSYAIDFWSKDVAGNVEATTTISVSVSATSGAVAKPVAESAGRQSGYALDTGWPLAAGTGTPSHDYGMPQSVTYDRARDRLYMGAWGYEGVHRFGWDGAYLSPSAMASYLYYYDPVGVGVDRDGNVTAIFKTQSWARWNSAGTETAWHSYWWADALSGDVSPDGYLWHSKMNGGVTRTAADGTYGVPVGVVNDLSFAGTGEAYFACADKWVRVYSANGDLLREWALAEVPSGIEVDGDGYVYVVFGSSVTKFTSLGGVVEVFSAASPRRIAVDAEGHAYVLEAATRNVRRYVHGLKPTSVTAVGRLTARRESAIAGKVTPAIAGIPLRVQYSADGASWSDVASVLTGDGGAYSYRVVPADKGSYRVIAAGDRTFAGSVSQPMRVNPITAHVRPQTSIRMGPRR